MTTTNALYIINLIEANLNARQGVGAVWNAADFDDVVAKCEARTKPPKTFGQRKPELLEFADEPFFYLAYKLIDGDLIAARNNQAHEGRYTRHGVTIEDVQRLESLAAVSVGHDFSPLPDLQAIERAFYARIDAKHGRQKYASTTWGQRIVELYRARIIDKKTARRYWKLSQIRNKVIHTGETLPETEKRFVKSFTV